MQNQPIRRTRAHQAGFTLIEILLVVVIIGLLASVAAINVPKNLEKGRVNKAKADIRNIGLAVESYYMDEGRYPGSLDALSSGDDPYLKGGVIPDDPWGGVYSYSYPGSHKPYKYDLQTTTPEGKTIANWNMMKKD